MNAIEDVLAERQRQIEVEGFSEAFDDKNDDGELAAAAFAYIDNYLSRAWMILNLRHGLERYQRAPPPKRWPRTFLFFWKPKTPRYDLVRAAALLIAEIDRIDRAEVVAAERRRTYGQKAEVSWM